MASIDDILTTAKNLVVAVSGLAQTYLQVQGNQRAAAIASTSLIATGSGRLVNVNVTTPGSTNGTIYDSSQITDTSRPIHVIVNGSLGPININITYIYGLVVVPGTSQVVTVSYS